MGGGLVRGFPLRGGLISRGTCKRGTYKWKGL